MTSLGHHSEACLSYVIACRYVDETLEDTTKIPSPYDSIYSKVSIMLRKSWWKYLGWKRKMEDFFIITIADILIKLAKDHGLLPVY